MPSPGLPYSTSKMLRWISRTLGEHEQVLGIAAKDAALEMYDLTLSPDDANLVESGRQAETIFEQNMVDPRHVRHIFHLDGQLTVYKGKKIEEWCRLRPHECQH